MAGRTRTEKRVPKKILKNVATQTDLGNDAITILQLKEKVDLLNLQLYELRRNQQGELAGSQRKQKVEIPIMTAADSPQAEKIRFRGCTCKGACSTKICGCVKKQAACTEACKCQHAKCENQDPNKENNSPNTKDGSLSKLNNTYLQTRKNKEVLLKSNPNKNHSERGTQGTAGPPKKGPKAMRALGAKIFSPDSPESYKNDISISKLDYDTPMKLVTFDKNYSPDTDSSPRRKNKPTKKSAKNQLELHMEKSQDINGSDLIDEVNEKSRLRHDEIDPMKPTRQLQRTPVSASTSINHSKYSISELPVLYLELPKGQKQNIPLPIDIDNPEVNWKEHIAQLKPCKYCERTFYPHRIERHEASCKGN